MKSSLISNKKGISAISLFLIILILAFGLVQGETYSTSLSSWVSYENNASYKWCKSSSTTSGYICSAAENTSNWGYYSSTRWSSDSSYLPQHSKYLLCPSDYSIWRFSTLLLRMNLSFLMLNLIVNLSLKFNSKYRYSSISCSSLSLVNTASSIWTILLIKINQAGLFIFKLKYSKLFSI